MEQGGRTRKENQCWCCCCLLSPGQPRDEVINSIWSHLTFHVSQSRSCQHSGTIDLQLANILMCTGMCFNQLLSQPFPVYFSEKKVCSCEKVSLSRFLCWQEGGGTAVSVCAQSSRTQVQTNIAPPKQTLLSLQSVQTQGTKLCDWHSPSFVVTEWH